MTPDPIPTPAKTPASAPIGALLAGAAVAAVQAIIPLATGTTPNVALMIATGIIVFGATLAAALYHLQLPSDVQQAAITEVTALITAAVSAHTHPVVTVAPPAVNANPARPVVAEVVAPSPAPVPAAPSGATPPAAS